MKEIYDWVPWFKELANKIAEGGEEYLIDKANRVEWHKDDTVQPLLKYGDENIDPFSFIYSVAARSMHESVREHLYPSIEETFDMSRRLPPNVDEAIIFPVPPAVNVLFHDGVDYNPELLWKLFRGALGTSGEMDAQDFERTLRIRGVATPKLTQTLFLINPDEFIPIDNHTTSLGLFSFERPPPQVTLAQYRGLIGRVRDVFPGCELFETNIFAYLRSTGKLTVHGDRCFQISTNVYNEYEDYWDEFDSSNSAYTGGPGNNEGWDNFDPNGPPVGYPLNEPDRGDVLLVRYAGQSKGIGIVYRNDYRQSLSDDSRIHVLWLNKQHVDDLLTNPRGRGFSHAHKIAQQFREAPAYAATFELLDRLSTPRTAPGPDLPERPNFHLVEHSRNRILYGPPGTGKTWNAVNHALAIVDGEEVRSDIDRDRFHSLRFNPETDEGQIAMATFHQNFAYEDFVEGIRPKLEGQKVAYKLHDGIFKKIAKAANDATAAGLEKRFILIIDEINRGNIAKIFGELITLIEDTRRLGQVDATRVTLPYSSDVFGVPDNLYIIGTMNTADRSIQLLDTALRRRFVFFEMMPEPRHPGIERNIEGVDGAELLKAINERVATLLDREHQIGHTYLLHVGNLEELSFTFRNKIFPLLQEYFFDDWMKMRAVLGNNSFVDERKPGTLLSDSDLVDADHRTYERLPDDDERWHDPDEYKRIYQSE